MSIHNAQSKVKMYLGNRKVKKAYIGKAKVYSAGNPVTYHVDKGVAYIEDVDEGASCLSPTSFLPTKAGWTFVGWREDTAASPDVLSIKIMQDSPITLYAVFSKTVTLSFNPNGGTAGNVPAQSKTAYYNAAGTVVNPTFTMPHGGFTKPNYTMLSWTINGVYHNFGKTITLSDSATALAAWVVTNIANFGYNGGVQAWTVPYTGTYRLTVHGASSGKLTWWNGNRYPAARGGTSVGTVRLTAGTVLYVGVGGQGADNTVTTGGGTPAFGTGGLNGGGIGTNIAGAGGLWGGYPGGGGCTHIALNANRGWLSSYVNNKADILIVAGGAGGGNDVRQDGTGGGLNGGGISGGMQTAPGTEGYIKAGFGYGARAGSNGGGGGGWYGGGDGSGGSGYIGGVTNGSTTNGTAPLGHGSALIQLLSIG